MYMIMRFHLAYHQHFIAIHVHVCTCGQAHWGGVPMEPTEHLHVHLLQDYYNV